MFDENDPQTSGFSNKKVQAAPIHLRAMDVFARIVSMQAISSLSWPNLSHPQEVT